MEKLNLQDSITIKADYIRETKDSWFLDCEGDVVWFPKSQVNFDKEDKSLEAPKWLLVKKFPNEKW